MPQENPAADKNYDKKERAGKNSFFFWCLGFLMFIGLEQAAKHFARNIFRNYVFAFSLPLPVVLIYVIYFLVLAAIIYYLGKNYKNLSSFSKLAWTLILAGAASNIGERIFLGYVRDFIYISLYRWTGIYNLADGYIILGVIILLVAN